MQAQTQHAWGRPGQGRIFIDFIFIFVTARTLKALNFIGFKRAFDIYFFRDYFDFEIDFGSILACLVDFCFIFMLFWCRFSASILYRSWMHLGTKNGSQNDPRPPFSTKNACESPSFLNHHPGVDLASRSVLKSPQVAPRHSSFIHFLGFRGSPCTDLLIPIQRGDVTVQTSL